MFGDYHPVDTKALAALPETSQQEVETIRASAKRVALFKVAVLPLIMLVSYLALIAYFRAKGGYQAIYLTTADKVPEEGHQS